MVRTIYKPYGLVLSQSQKNAISEAIRNKEAITIKLGRANLKNGSDVLNLTQRQINKLNKAFDNNKGSMIKISKTQIRKLVNNERRIAKAEMAKMLKGKNNQLIKLAGMKGNGFLSSIIPAVTRLAPKVLGAIGLSGLMGLLEGAAKKLFGGCYNPNEGQIYIVDHNRIPELLTNAGHLLNDKQKHDVHEAIQTGKGVAIRPTKSQVGGFLPILLSTIGGILLNKLLGNGMQFPKVVSKGGAMQFMQNPYLVPYHPPYQVPEFYGNGNKGKKKVGQGLLLGKNSPLNEIPIIGDIF